MVHCGAPGRGGRPGTGRGGGGGASTCSLTCGADANLDRLFMCWEKPRHVAPETQARTRGGPRLSDPSSGNSDDAGTALPSRDSSGRPGAAALATQRGPAHRRAHAPRARPAPLHPGTRHSRHFAGRSLALAAAILRWRPARGGPGPRERRPPATAWPGVPLPIAAGGADSTPGPPRRRPRPGACRRRPASSGRP